MKSIRFLPLCLAALSLPVVLTGCNNAGTGSTASTDTNAAPPADTNAPAAPAASNAPGDTNAAPAKADTNAAPATTTNGT